MIKKTILLLSCIFAVAFVNAQADSLDAAADSIVEDVIVPPGFDGGLDKFYDYIYTNFHYPEEAGRRNVSGTVEVEFTVERSGDITHANLLKGLDYSIDDVVLELLKAMPRWIPATKNGIPVRYKVSMPLTIRPSRNKGLRSGESLFDYRVE
ncbi:MAG: energy transducer TonB [Bacteroidaceae bacterium]|nr:energy transducer TonB [Bacteroidaceae bacterium]